VTAVKVARKRAIESDHPNPYPTEESIEGAIESYLDQNGVTHISDEFPGIARELARMVLPVATYSEMYWKGNMHNLFHFLNLRCDSHAQYEIRIYAETILGLIRPHAEWSVEAFEDYLLNASRLSRMETEVVRALLEPRFATIQGADTPRSPVISDLMEKQGCSEREITDFLAKFG
jgi:thymidylate synthase (FAD)